MTVNRSQGRGGTATATATVPAMAEIDLSDLDNFARGFPHGRRGCREHLHRGARALRPTVRRRHRAALSRAGRLQLRRALPIQRDRRPVAMVLDRACERSTRRTSVPSSPVPSPRTATWCSRTPEFQDARRQHGSDIDTAIADRQAALPVPPRSWPRKGVQCPYPNNNPREVTVRNGRDRCGLAHLRAPEPLA
jgi:hypothetical protein